MVRAQSKRLCTGLWGKLSACPQMRPPAHRGGRRCPRGPAERDGEVRSFPKPSKLPGILYSMGRVVEVGETLNFLNTNFSFQLTCQEERPDTGLWGSCHYLVVFVKIN